MTLSLKNLLLTIIATALAFLAVEILLRSLWPEYDPSQRMQYVASTATTPALGVSGKVYRLAKNTGDYDVAIEFNHHGLRDTKDVAQASTADILVLGDSFSFGWGVEQSQRYSELIDQHLVGSVYNIASPSASIDDYLKQLNYARSLGARPGSAIVSVCMENDLLRYDLLGKATSTETTSWNLKRWLRKNSALAIAGTYYAHQSPWLYKLFVKRQWIRPNLSGINGEQVSRQALEESVALLKLIGNQIPTQFLIIPSRGLWAGGHRDKVRQTHAQFIELMKQSDLDYIDPIAVFEKKNQPLDYHFERDGHWNAHGHQLVAEVLKQQLTDERK